MKTSSFKNLLVAAALTLTPLALHAQTTVTTTTGDGTATAATTTTTQATNSEGTIQTFTPGQSQIVVKTTAGAPVTYSYSKKTTFVDADGNVVNYESIKAGDPTTVYYTTENGQPVVSKVVVRRAAPVSVTKTETSETTTSSTTGRK